MTKDNMFTFCRISKENMSNINKILEKKENEMGMKISKTYFINKIIFDFINNSNSPKDKKPANTKEDKRKSLISRVGKAEVQKLFNRPNAFWKDDLFYTWNYVSRIDKPGTFTIDKNGYWYDQASGKKGDIIDLYMIVFGIQENTAIRNLNSIIMGE